MDHSEWLNELRAKDLHTWSDVEQLRQLATLESNDAELWDLLGDLMQICCDHAFPIEDSVDCYGRAIACDGSYAPAYESLGYIYDAYFDDFERAESCFRRALDCGAGDMSRVGLARVLAQRGDSEGALAELECCSSPSHESVRQLRAEIESGFWDGQRAV